MNVRFQIPNFDTIDKDSKGFKTVISRTLNRIGSSAKTLANRTIRDTYNIDRAGVAANIKVQNATPDQLILIMSISGKQLPLALFIIGQTSQGVQVEVKKGRRYVLPHSFVATMVSGHEGVFIRSKGASKWSKGRPHTSSPNLPIDEQYRISVAQMFSSAGVTEVVRDFIEEKFPEVLQEQLNFYLLSNN